MREFTYRITRHTLILGVIGLLLCVVMVSAGRSQEPPAHEVEAIEDGYTSLDRCGLLMVIEGYQEKVTGLVQTVRDLKAERDQLRGLTQQYTRTIKERGEVMARMSARLGERPTAFVPENARPFSYNAVMPLGDTMMESIEFTPKRCNIVFRNTTGKRADVDVQVIVMNADGVMLWVGTEDWWIDMLADEEKHLASLAMSLSMPGYLQSSVFAKNFDTKPKWFRITDHSRN